MFLSIIVKVLLTQCFDVLMENVHKSGLTNGAGFISYRFIHGLIKENAT